MPTNRTGSLPAELTTLVGRRAESVEIRRLLSTARLVTLLGAGGVGKTRLSLVVARRVAPAFSDGVWLVELADLRDPDLLAATVLNMLAPGRPAKDLHDLVEYVSTQQILMVLDNCEHLIGQTAELVDQLLHQCPNARVLATSRVPLRIAGEAVFAVPPLSIPVDDSPLKGDPTHYDAVKLFCDRASAAAPSFTLTEANQGAVVTLCRELDGLPLAVELAAVSMRALSPGDLLARHTDRFKVLGEGSRGGPRRHQTLRAAVDWSYNLCSEVERTLWSRSSIFLGGMDLHAAQSVCVDGRLPADQVISTLTGLVDKSILTFDGTQYKMLETIRMYGAERLRDFGEEETLGRRHRDYCLGLAEEVERQWFGPSQLELLTRTRREHPNLRAALEFCLVRPDEARVGQRMASALWAFWIRCGFQREGRHWLNRLLAADPEPSPERVSALWVDANLAVLDGDIPLAFTSVDECLRLASTLNDQVSVAHASFVRGLGELFRHDVEQAVVDLRTSVTLERATPEPRTFLATALLFLGISLCDRDSVDEAVEALEEARAISVSHGETWIRSWTMVMLGLAHWIRGDMTAAEELVRTGLADVEQLDDPLRAGMAVEFLAWTSLNQGHAQRAAALMGASRMLFEPLGPHLAGFQRIQEWSLDAADEARMILGAHAFDAAVEDGRHLAKQEWLALALSRPGTKAKSPSVGEAAVLTSRESQIGQLIAQGWTNKHIAQELVVSPRTVDTHVQNILIKLGFTSRAQVAALFGPSSD